MKKIFLITVYLTALTSCQPPFPEKLKDYVEGKGYCIARYDEAGCNVCSLDRGSSFGWFWACTEMACYEKDGKTFGNKEKAKQCTKYLSEKEFEKFVKKSG